MLTAPPLIRPFRFGAIVHPDYMDLALRLPPLEDRLNERIELRDYTDQVDRVYFAPILMPETTDSATAFSEERRFDPEQRSIWLQVRLNMAEVADLSGGGFETWIAQRLEAELRALSMGRVEIELGGYLGEEEE